MKILMGKKQYNLFLESKNGSLFEIVKNFVDKDMSFPGIRQLLIMPANEFYSLIKDYPITIDCFDAYECISDILQNTNLIHKKKDYGKFQIRIELDPFIGTFNFCYEDKNCRMRGLSTIYWDGSCSFPIDIEYFRDFETEEYGDEFYDFQKIVNPSLYPVEYNSISEMIDFMNENYFDLIVPEILDAIPYCKTQLGL